MTAGAAVPVFLDEYTATGTLVQSIPMPTSASGTNHALVASSTATSEGLLTLSPDSHYLALTGYDAPVSTAAIAGTAGAATPRVVGVVDSDGNVNTSNEYSDFASSTNPRSAVVSNVNANSSGKMDVWLAGAAGGIRYANSSITSSGSAQTSLQLSTTVTNLRQVNIFGDQLYTSDSSGSAVRLGTVGSGTPTTAGQTITNLPGFATTTSPYGFYFTRLQAGAGAFDTVYVADDGANAIQKWSLVSGTWTQTGAISASGVRGLTGSTSGGSVTLYATTGASAAAGGGTIYKVTDATGYNTTASGAAPTLITAQANTAFRGIAFAPTPVPPPVVPESRAAFLLPGTAVLLLGGGWLVLRRRRHVAHQS
jgi:hypothetical protein